MFYVLRDFKIHLRKRKVIFAESVVGFLMLFDVVLYSIINNFKMNYLFFLEWATIIFFIITFFYISTIGINDLDEDIELSLMVLRIILQFVRLSLAILRIKENSKKRTSAAKDIEMNVTMKSMG